MTPLFAPLVFGLYCPVTMFEEGSSLEEGLRSLPFFWKGKRYLDYPVNPVSLRS
jgi:hypothetical protein